MNVIVKQRKVGSNMVFSVMFALLTITTEDSYSIVKLNQIQAIEMVGLGDEGGILTITLKGDKSEQIVYKVHSEDEWKEAVKWIQDMTLNLSDEMSKTDTRHLSNSNVGF